MKNRAAVSEITHSHETVHSSSNTALLLNEGEFWTLAYGSLDLHLKATKGIRYLILLLQNPGTQFRAFDLVQLADAPAAAVSVSENTQRARIDPTFEQYGSIRSDLGDAGELLDARSKAEYRRRLEELSESLEQAKHVANHERALAAEQEIDALTRELARAVGLGGRDRRASSGTERARLNVTRAIKSVIEKIRIQNEELGRNLTQSIRTGLRCSYLPSAGLKIEWKFQRPDEPAGSQASTRSGAESAAAIPTFALNPPVWIAERTPLVARETELAELKRLLDRTFEGRGGTALIAGDAGIGKTRLALEAAKDASMRGAQFLAGRCYDSTEPHPYIPFVELIDAALEQAPSLSAFADLMGENAPELVQLAPALRRIFSEIPAAPELDPRDTRRYLFDGFTAFVARVASNRPLVLFLDDLQWADEPTLDLAAHLGRRVQGMPVLIIASYRDIDLSANPRLTSMLESWIRGGTRLFRINGLSELEVAAMLRSLGGGEVPPGLLSSVYEATRGNPFFIEEVLKDLRERSKNVFDTFGHFLPEARLGEQYIPENIRLVLRGRMDRLTDDTRQALIAAAIFGDTFSFMVLEALQQFSSEQLMTAVEEAQRAGLIVTEGEEGDSMAFGHGLIRQTLLADLSAPRLERLNLMAAEALERTYGDLQDEHVAAITGHLVKAGAGQDERLVPYLIKAGEQHLKRAAYFEAISSLSRVLELNEHRHVLTNRLHHARARNLLGRAYMGVGNFQESVKQYELSVGLTGYSMPSGRRPAIRGVIGEIGIQVARRWWPRTKALDSQMRASTELAADTYERLTQFSYHQSDPIRSIYCLIRSLNLAEKASLADQTARSLAGIPIAAAFASMHGLAERYVTLALAAKECCQKPQDHAFVAEYLGMYRAGSGRDWRQAIDLFKEAARLFERVGNRRRHLETLSLLSIAMLHHGDLSNAIEIRKQVYDLACTQQDPQMQGIALIELGEAALRSAEVRRAAELLERARSLEEHAGSVDRIWMYGMLAAARVRLGDPEAAAKAAASGWKCVTPDQPPAFYILDGLSGLAEAEISRWLARPSQECRARLADVLRLLRKFSRSFPIARPRALLWTGVLASIEKDGKRARKLWERGRTLAREMKMAYDESILAAQFENESAFLRWNLDLPAAEADSREDGKIVAGR